MRRSDSALIASLLFTTALITTGCNPKPVIGVLLPMSGEIASYGESMKNGIDLALEEAEADGTRPANMELVWGDSASQADVAVQEYRRLVKDGGAKLVIAGVTSGSAKEMLPAIDDLNVIALSPSASAPMLTKESKLFYRVFASDELEGRRAGRFLYEDMSDHSVLIYTGDNEHARGIEPMFRHMYDTALGGKVVGKINLTDTNWKHESSDLLAAHEPESVYIIAYAEHTLEVLRHLRSSNFKGTVCVTSGFHSGQVIEDNPELVEGVFFPQPAFDTKDERPLVQDFVKAYEAEHGLEPDIYAAHSYDAMKVVMEIIRITRIFETSEIRKSLAFGLSEYPGVTGIIQFNELGDVHHNPIMFVVHEGRVLNYDRWVEEKKAEIHKKLRRILGQ
ncbi:MAG: amino acid ABC transporter substrate-binding protein [bacterium]|nr:amino acid ABC transporter substrate-binding protein [bacterium]